MTRAGNYAGSNTGWAYVNGWPFDNILRSYVFSSEFTSYAGKVGVIESITSSTGNRDSYNGVTHTRKRYEAPLVPVSNQHRSIFKTRELNITSTGSISCGPGNLDYGLTLGSYANSVDSQLSRVIAKMDFGVSDSGFNLPVFLGELSDFKSLFDGFGRFLTPQRGLSDAFSKFHSLWKNAGRKPVTTVVKGIASANLFKNFVVEPLLADINGILTANQHLLKQIEKLRSSKPIVVRAGSTEYLGGTTVYDVTSNPFAHGWKTTVSGSRTVRAQAHVQYHWDALVKPPTKAELWLDTLGVDQPIAAAWESIPFTWLVDYFVGIGDFLDQFDGRLVAVPYTIIKDGYSVKTEKRAKTDLFVDNGSQNALWKNFKGTTVSGTLDDLSYTRTKGPLNYSGIAVPQLRMPSFKQAGNIASVIALFRA